MLKVRNFFVILAAIVLFSSVSEARVCFLAGSDSEEGCLTSSYEIESERCPGFMSCEYPQKGGRVCIDLGEYLYLPENCCSNTEFYEPCDGEGMVCGGTTCTGENAEGESMSWCEIGKCQCDSSYSETCSSEDGLEGVGEPCGSKYQSCRCKSGFYVCDASAIGEGNSCSDSRGTLYSSCVCPTAGTGNWVSDPNDCCGSYSSVCTNRPDGGTVYKCVPTSLPECVCGYSYSTTKSNCVNGCTDSSYEYYGSALSNATCTDTLQGLSEGTICANDCQCNDGYWDFVETCLKQNDDVCETLGYVDTECSGDWVACPYDMNAKKCIKKRQQNLCPVGYSANLTDISTCGTSGDKGWEFASKEYGEGDDKIICNKCVAKLCASGSTEKPQCEEYFNVSEVGYSGDKPCYECEKDGEVEAGDPDPEDPDPEDPDSEDPDSEDPDSEDPNDPKPNPDDPKPIDPTPVDPEPNPDDPKPIDPTDPDPCDCPDGKPYLCDGVCSATGDHTCQMCFITGEQTPGSCSDCPNTHYWFCPSQLQCYPKSNDVKPYSDCVACDQAPSIDIGDGTEDGTEDGDDGGDDDSGSNPPGGGITTGGNLTERPAHCQVGIDYCDFPKYSYEYQTCCNNDDESSSSVAAQ